MGVVGLLVGRYVPVARVIPMWGCTFRKITGWPCPGCGLTRVADHFAHLHFWRAFVANPLGFLAACAFVVIIIASVVHVLTGLRPPRLKLSDREWLVAFTVAMVLAFVNYGWVIAVHRGWLSVRT